MCTRFRCTHKLYKSDVYSVYGCIGTVYTCMNSWKEAFNPIMSNYSAISWQEQTTFDENMMMSALFWTNMLGWILLVLALWINNQLEDMSLHTETLFWLGSNQSLLLLLNIVFLSEKQQISISIFWRTCTHDLQHSRQFTEEIEM